MGEVNEATSDTATGAHPSNITGTGEEKGTRIAEIRDSIPESGDSMHPCFGIVFFVTENCSLKAVIDTMS